MTAPSNLNFATPDPSGTGLALGWTPTIRSSARGYSRYASDAWSTAGRRAEMFAGGWPAPTKKFFFQADPAPAPMTCAGNGYANGQTVVVQESASTGLTPGNVYFVVNVGSTYLNLALTPGGPPVAVTLDGDGYLFPPTNEYALSALSETVVPPWASCPSAMRGVLLNELGARTEQAEDFSISANCSTIASDGSFVATLKTAAGVAYVFPGTPNMGGVVGVYNLLSGAQTFFDGFEQGWSTAGYSFGPLVPGVSATRGHYDSGTLDHEPFDSWSTAGYFLGPNVVDTNTTRGAYDSTLADSAETFRTVLPCTFAPSGSLPSSALTVASGSRPQVGDAVQLTTTGTLPAPLTEGATLWCVSSSGSTFALSTTRGGSAISITAAGSGTHSLAADPAFGWLAGTYV